MSYPIKPRQELAFWATLRQMAEKASYQAPAMDGAYNAYRLVAEHAAQKQEYWQSISGIAAEPSEARFQQRARKPGQRRDQL